MTVLGVGAIVALLLTAGCGQASTGSAVGSAVSTPSLSHAVESPPPGGLLMKDDADYVRAVHVAAPDDRCFIGPYPGMDGHFLSFGSRSGSETYMPHFSLPNYHGPATYAPVLASIFTGGDARWAQDSALAAKAVVEGADSQTVWGSIDVFLRSEDHPRGSTGNQASMNGAWRCHLVQTFAQLFVS